MNCINVLAVNDPAVKAYTKSESRLSESIGKKLGIRVNIDVIDFDKYYEKLMDAFNGNDYDIVMVAGHLWLPSFVEKEYLAEIEFEDNESFDYKDVLETIRNEMTYKNKQYLMPSFCDGHMVLYRKSHIDLDNKGPVTVKDITKELEKYQSTPMTPFVLKAHESEVFLDFLPYLRGFGVEPFDDNGKPLFNCEEGVRALKRYKYLLEYTSIKAVEFGNDEVREEIQKDRCYLGLTWGGQLAAVMDDRCESPDSWSFAYPENPWNVTWSFGINKKSVNKELAVNVLMELTDKEVDRQVGRICGNPTRESNFRLDESRFRWYNPVKEMISASQPLAKFPQLPDSIGAVGEELRQVIVGVKTAEEALMAAEVKVMTLLASTRCGSMQVT